jgi:hypothetical protein
LGTAVARKIDANALIIVDATITSTTVFEASSSDGYSLSTYNNILDATYTDVLYIVNSDSGMVELIILEGAGVGSDEVYGVFNGNYVTSDDARGIIALIDEEVVEFNAAASSPVTVDTTSDKFLYEIVFDSNGNGMITSPGALNTAATGFVVSNDNYATNGSFEVGIRGDVVVYNYVSADSDWEVGDLADITTAKMVKFYDTVDDSVTMASIILVY